MPHVAYEFGPYRMDAAARRLWRHGHPIALSTQGCDLLLALLERSPQVVERESIERRVWPDTFVSPESLRIAVHRLRRTLDDEGESPRYVETIAKQGYRFRPPVDVLDGPESATKTLAILPFEGDMDGIADTLITRLHRIRHLVVRPLAATSAAASGTRDIEDISRQLKVDLILNGRLDVQGDVLRLALRLISASDNQVIWARRFTGSVADPFTFEETVSRDVADALALKLTPVEGRILEKRETSNIEARRLYCRGVHLMNQRTPDAIRKAGELFAQAVEQDPRYAAAWTARAEVATLSVYYLDRPSSEFMPQANTYARRALELDDDLSPAYAALAHVLFRYDWDFVGADRMFRRAIELSPANATAHHWYSNLLVVQRRPDEALAENEIAQEIDPLSRLYCATRVWLLMMAGRYADAVRHYHDHEEILAGHPVARLFLGWAYALDGNFEAACGAFKALEDIGGGLLALASSGYALAKAGRRADALAIRDRIRDVARVHYVQPDIELLVNVGLEDDEATIRSLERGCDERTFNMVIVGAHPMFAHLAGNPGYQAVLRRIGLDRI